MGAPKSPITVLADALNAMPALSGFAKVYAGKNALPLGRQPPSIVIFPVEAGYNAPHDNVNSIADVDLKLAAHLWASNLDEAWDLRQRYVQALKEQAIGNPGQPIVSLPSQAGAFIEFVDEKWDIHPDTAQQGQELEVIVAIRLSASPTVQLGDGEIDAVALHGTQGALAAPLGVADTTAVVLSTSGFAASGALSIDQEQITYSGTTPTTFTGLTRGVNGTTPATHASAATVTQ